jgi:hypothetical protein
VVVAEEGGAVEFPAKKHIFSDPCYQFCTKTISKITQKLDQNIDCVHKLRNTYF